MTKGLLDLTQLSLDESGRVILGDENLQAIEQDYFAVSGGGYYTNGDSCGGTNPYCLNTDLCNATTNTQNCSNTGSCSGSSNTSHCS